jgi:hypothetical protein
MPSVVPVEKVEIKLRELGFVVTSEAIVSSDHKYWHRKIYRGDKETVSVSDELGEAYHLRDPVITVCGRNRTIEALRCVL